MTQPLSMSRAGHELFTFRFFLLLQFGSELHWFSGFFPMAEFISNRKEMKASMQISMQMKPGMAKLISDLPIERGWNAADLHYYHGTQLPTTTITATLALEAHFRSRPDDFIITTTPKSGTTWLKALAFAIRRNTCIMHGTTFSLDPIPTS